MGNKIRTFIAIDINDDIRACLKKLQDHLRSLDCDIKWVDPKNAHLTLKFLGEIKPKRIDDIDQALTEWAASCGPFEAEMSEPGAFPSIEHPKIIWVGIRDDQHRIADLASSLENKLGNIGFKKEKKEFNPHLTLGRVKIPKNLQILSQVLSEYTFPEPINLSIKEVILYKSALTSSGPIYEILDNFYFNKR